MLLPSAHPVRDSRGKKNQTTKDGDRQTDRQIRDGQLRKQRFQATLKLTKNTDLLIKDF